MPEYSPQSTSAPSAKLFGKSTFTRYVVARCRCDLGMGVEDCTVRSLNRKAYCDLSDERVPVEFDNGLLYSLSGLRGLMRAPFKSEVRILFIP